MTSGVATAAREACRIRAQSHEIRSAEGDFGGVERGIGHVPAGYPRTSDKASLPDIKYKRQAVRLVRKMLAETARPVYAAEDESAARTRIASLAPGPARAGVGDAGTGIEHPVEAAFMADRALNTLDNLVRNEPEWSAGWRHRLPIPPTGGSGGHHVDLANIMIAGKGPGQLPTSSSSTNSDICHLRKLTANSSSTSSAGSTSGLRSS